MTRSVYEVRNRSEAATQPRSWSHPIPSLREALNLDASCKVFARVPPPGETTNERRKAMKKLLLIALAISGLAFVTAQRGNAQATVLVPRTEGLSFGFPAGYSGYPSYLNYYPYGYYRHPYVHYYPYAGNPYSYYSAPPSYRYSVHRSYHRHHHHSY